MTGVRTLLGAFLRRDRFMILLWAVGGMVLYWAQAYSVDELYVSQEEFDRAAASMENNAAFIALAGPPRALNTIGGQVTWQATAFGAILAGLMSMVLVGRHTRAEEESGRDELVRAAAIDRRAPMTAAVVVALLANVLLGLLVALSLITYPLAVADSVALGVGLMLCGWLFTGVALVAAQLTATTRSMYGITGAVIGVAYVLRAIGDLGPTLLTWLSPIGWYQAMHAFSGLRWWPALPILAAAAATFGAAYAVFERRDSGSGILATRPGSARAGRGLHSAVGLAWHLHRGAVIGWVVGLGLTGVSYGAIGDEVEELMGDSGASEMFVQGGGSLVDGFYATAGLLLGLMAAGYAIASALRPRTEEDAGRVEALLATALPRWRWLLGHVVITVVGVVALLLAAGVGLAVGYGLVTGDVGEAVRRAPPVLLFVLPVLVLSGVARLLVGISPRLGTLAWVPLVLALVVMLFGDLFQLPQWLQDLSPFEHVPLVPVEDFRWQPLAALGAVALALSAAGQAAFARRDLS